MKTTDKERLLRRIREIQRRLDGEIVVTSEREQRAGDYDDYGTVVDEGEHVSVVLDYKVLARPASGEERERLLKELEELKRQYREAVASERDEEIRRKARELANEIKATGKVSVYGYDSVFQLEPLKAIEYCERIGNKALADAIRLALSVLCGGK